MVTLTFDLDYEKMKRDGITEDDMLEPMREHARKHGIIETSKGVFSMDGENALCSLTMYVSRITRKNIMYVTYFKNWILDVDGETEDCIAATLRWYKKKGINAMEV